MSLLEDIRRAHRLHQETETEREKEAIEHEKAWAIRELSKDGIVCVKHIGTARFFETEGFTIGFDCTPEGKVLGCVVKLPKETK